MLNGCVPASTLPAPDDIPQRLAKHDNETRQPVPLTRYVQDCLRSEARRPQGNLPPHNLLTCTVMSAAVCS
jgi:hypothetical protein